MVTYGLISSNSRVVCDVPDYVLAPYEWMVIIGLELAGNEIRPCIKCLKPLLTVRVCEVALNREYRCGPNTVANNTE